MKKTIAILFLSIIAAVAMTSCSHHDYYDDEYYYSPLVGNWQLYSVNGVPVAEIDVSEFVFRPNGTGTYGQYNEFGTAWNTYALSWECDFPDPMTNLLYVNTWSGAVWIYQFRVSADRLILKDTLTGDVLVYYAY